jgi:hypothetical protein
MLDALSLMILIKLSLIYNGINIISLKSRGVMPLLLHPAIRQINHNDGNKAFNLISSHLLNIKTLQNTRDMMKISNTKH